MIDRQTPTAPDVERVRQSRGLSWKVGALLAVALVASVAGAKLLEQPARTPEPDVEVAVVPSPVMSAAPQPGMTVRPDVTALPTRPAPPTATPMPQIEPPPQVRFSEVKFGADAFALIARIDGRLYFDVLNEQSPGSFTGIFRLPFPSNSTGSYQFDLVQLWSKDERDRNYVEIGRWDVDLTVLEEGTDAGGQVLSASAAAKQRARAAPRAVRRGYSIVLDAESRYSYGVISVAVEFGNPM